MHSSSTTLGSLPASPYVLLWLLSILVALPALPSSQSEKLAKCRHVVLAGNQWPASIWRPRQFWLSGWPWSSQPGKSWRFRDSLGPWTLWRLRWQLWNQLFGKLLGPRRQRRVTKLGDQCSGKVSTSALILPPPSFQAHTLHASLVLQIPHSVSPSLQGTVAQPGYGSVRGNPNTEVRGRVWGRRGCLGACDRKWERRRGKKDREGGA